MTRPLIEIRGASFSYAERLIFDGLDLEVHAGEVLTVLGTNGCGKSTLLRCMGGALRLAAGSVRIGGEELSSLTPVLRARKVGFLFQDHIPSFPFAVLDVVTMGRNPYLSHFGAPSKRDTAIAEEALDKVGMLHLKSRPYTELSGGERQMVLLSRTLAQQPEVILLDEPTSHLDFKNQVRCLQTIGQLAAQGVTMVMTTHDPNHAFVFSGRAVLMRPGAAIQAGPVSEVITEASLRATYGIPVGLFSVPRLASEGSVRLCSPW